MAKQVVDAVKFVSVFEPMAKRGESATAIGVALGLKGDPKKIAQYVSVRASQLRSGLKQLALDQARTNNLNKEDTQNLVKSVVNKLPTLRKRGRPNGEKMVVINNVLAKLNELNGQ
jgi:hypothetical protein